VHSNRLLFGWRGAPARRRFFLRRLCSCGALLLWVTLAHATGTYQAPEDFLREVFAGQVPAPKKLWITDELKRQIDAIMDHDLGVLRLSYWARDERTAWILEEIGKEQPITTGIVVNAGKVERLKVLIFRESRGWEIRHPFFTDQFHNVGLKPDTQLDRNIDGISGATLSVTAMKKLARLALMLDAWVKDHAEH